MAEPIPFPVKDKGGISPLKLSLVYLSSFFIPPAGVFWAFRFLRNSDPSARSAGFMIISLTIVSSVLSVLLFLSLTTVIAAVR
ncbi:MAG: hypothetical protein Q7S03_02460 [bacterium]|nr:hypothetical protein [bacterium]